MTGTELTGRGRSGNRDRGRKLHKGLKKPVETASCVLFFLQTDDIASDRVCQ
jgi:hypothetical protein